MSLLPGVGTELAGAVRAVNAAWLAIPRCYRPAAAPWAALELEVNAACAAENRERAMAAISAWREHWLSQFSVALLNAPLEGEAA